jgi:hypothetical protein
MPTPAWPRLPLSPSLTLPIFILGIPSVEYRKGSVSGGSGRARIVIGGDRWGEIGEQGPKVLRTQTPEIGLQSGTSSGFTSAGVAATVAAASVVVGRSRWHLHMILTYRSAPVGRL